MTSSFENTDLLDNTAADLFTYAIDRRELKWLSDNLHPESDVSRNTLEYELQLLKIVCIGWAIAYYMEQHYYKTPLLKKFWLAIQEFSENLSTTTSLMTGTDINYFELIKTRLDQYVAVMSGQPNADQPASIIGPEFARQCGHENDIHAIMAGSKMFFTGLSAVKEYLKTVKMI